MYTFGWFMLTYGRNQDDIVKQLSSIKNKIKKENNHKKENIQIFQSRIENKMILHN